MRVGWGGENSGLRRVWEVKNYKKWVHVKPSGFAKLGLFFLTEAESRPLIFRCGWNRQFWGSLEFSQAGTLWGGTVTLGTRPEEVRYYANIYSSFYGPKLRPSEAWALRSLSRLWRELLSVITRRMADPRGFQGREILLCNTVMVDTCHYALSKPMECTTARENSNASYRL